jgi:hypothetical protein
LSTDPTYTLGDLEYFFWGGKDSQYPTLKAFYDAGISAIDLLSGKNAVAYKEGVSGTVEIDASLGSVHWIQCNGATTLLPTNFHASTTKSDEVTVIVTQLASVSNAITLGGVTPIGSEVTFPTVPEAFVVFKLISIGGIVYSIFDKSAYDEHERRITFLEDRVHLPKVGYWYTPEFTTPASTTWVTGAKDSSRMVTRLRLEDAATFTGWAFVIGDTTTAVTSAKAHASIWTLDGDGKPVALFAELTPSGGETDHIFTSVTPTVDSIRLITCDAVTVPPGTWGLVWGVEGDFLSTEIRHCQYVQRLQVADTATLWSNGSNRTWTSGTSGIPTGSLNWTSVPSNQATPMLWLYRSA